MKIAVSYLSSIFDNKSTIEKIDKTNADYLHVDLMDGKFVQKNNLNIKEVLALLKGTVKPLDIHLMVDKPEKYIEDLATLKPKRIIFHLESDTDINKTIELIKSKNIEVGIAIKPNTNCMELQDYLNKVDDILIMTVEPGAGGQKFMLNMLDKVKILDKIRKEKGYKYKLEVDGGINEYTIISSKLANVDIAVCGSYICHNENFQEKLDKLRKIIKQSK